MKEPLNLNATSEINRIFILSHLNFWGYLVLSLKLFVRISKLAKCEGFTTSWVDFFLNGYKGVTLLFCLAVEKKQRKYFGRTTLAFVTLGSDGKGEFMFYRNSGADTLLEEFELDYDLIKKVLISKDKNKWLISIILIVQNALSISPLSSLKSHSIIQPICTYYVPHELRVSYVYLGQGK